MLQHHEAHTHIQDDDASMHLPATGTRWLDDPLLALAVQRTVIVAEVCGQLEGRRSTKMHKIINI